METKELVYLFLYNPMVYTSGWTTISVHKSRKKHYVPWKNINKSSKKYGVITLNQIKKKKEHPFGKFEDWRVVPMILES
jgi:hypothetical protein